MSKFDQAAQGIPTRVSNSPASATRVAKPNNKALIRGDQRALNASDAKFAKSPKAQPATQDWRRG
jgi:hypothetical protein